MPKLAKSGVTADWSDDGNRQWIPMQAAKYGVVDIEKVKVQKPAFYFTIPTLLALVDLGDRWVGHWDPDGAEPK
jgi:hypothetical protein